MVNFEDIDEDIKRRLEDEVRNDPYDLSAESLYIRIYHSSGSDEELSDIFDVSITLIKKIKEIKE